MTYPMNELAIIAPIIFMVMIIGFPLIGLAVGWKRALYWGAGNFVFYVIGLIIWKTAGGVIGVKIAEILQQAIPRLKDVSITKLATSVAAPVFFILILLAANLLLLINYYAWFKKVAKIKADIAARKALKAVKKQYKEKGKKLPQVLTATTKDGVKVTEKAYGVRVGNRMIGFATMGLLMVPITASLTNAILYTTTSSSTRASNAFTNALYNSLNKTDKSLSWFSYYGGTSGDDIDALFSGLELYQSEITEPIKITDPNSGEEITIEVKPSTAGENPTVLDLVSNNVVDIVTNELVDNLKSFNTADATAEYKKAYEETTGTEEVKEEAAKNATNAFLGKAAQPINKLAGIWNGLVDAYQLPLQAVFNSANITNIIKDIIEQAFDFDPVTITTDIIEQIFGKNRNDGMYFKILDQYTLALQEGKDVVTIKFTVEEQSKTYEFTFKITILKELIVNLTSIENLKSLAMSFVKFDNVSEADQKLFSDAVDNIISLILVA